MPEVEADLEQLVLWDVRHLDEILEALLSVIAEGVDIRVCLGHIASLLN